MIWIRIAKNWEFLIWGEGGARHILATGRKFATTMSIYSATKQTRNPHLKKNEDTGYYSASFQKIGALCDEIRSPAISELTR